MSAAEAITTTDTRWVLPPNGMAWVDGHGDHAGHWESMEYADDAAGDQQVRFAEDYPEGDGQYVRVPADEPASLADVMLVPAEVERLSVRVERMREGVESTLALIDALLAGGVRDDEGASA